MLCTTDNNVSYHIDNMTGSAENVNTGDSIVLWLGSTEKLSSTEKNSQNFFPSANIYFSDGNGTRYFQHIYRNNTTAIYPFYITDPKKIERFPGEK